MSFFEGLLGKFGELLGKKENQQAMAGEIVTKPEKTGLPGIAGSEKPTAAMPASKEGQEAMAAAKGIGPYAEQAEQEEGAVDLTHEAEEEKN